MTETTMPGPHDFADAEHCVLEDVTIEHPKLYPEFTGRKDPEVVRDELVIRDTLRGRQTSMTIYEEGWIDLKMERRRNKRAEHRINLRYLDAVPTISRYYPAFAIKAAGIAGALTVLTGLPAYLGWLPAYTVPASVVAAVLTLTAGVLAYYLSRETITFQTLHGRAPAVCFVAGLGTIRRFQKLTARLVEAIADAAEAVHEETAVYLRAEMREHYRLCNEGVFSEDECSKSTGRILDNFGGPL